MNTRRRPAWPALLAALALPAAAAPFDLQAHRGGRGLAPESSLRAFSKSIALGVPTLELDLQVTRDHVLVVHHDDDLRGCDWEGLGNARFATIYATDVESATCDGEPIPTFDDVLEACAAAPYAVRVNAEIKVQDSRRSASLHETATLLVAALDRHGMRRRAIVQSFEPLALEAMRDVAPDVPTAALASSRDAMARALDASGIAILSPRVDQLREADVAEAHQRGVAVIPWVINDREVAERLISWGVDGLISDRPDLLLDLVPSPAPVEAQPEEAHVSRPNVPLALAAAVSLSLAVPAPARDDAPHPSAVERRDLAAVRSVAIYPFTSDGRVDTFCTSLFIQEVEKRKIFRHIVNPYELSVTIPDGQPFQPQASLQQFVEEGRAKGADAILVAEGRWYDLGFRMEYRVIETQSGHVVWRFARASGFGFSGPSMKRELSRAAANALKEALGGD